MNGGRGGGGGVYVAGSNPWLRTHTHHDGRGGVGEGGCHVTEYLGHGCEAGVEEVKAHGAAAVAARSNGSHGTGDRADVTRHTSHVTRHMSHVTRHTSHVTRDARTLA